MNRTTSPRSFARLLLSATALAALSMAGAISPAAATSAPSPHHGATTTTRISIPMVAVAKPNAQGVTPNLVIPGDCGTAFLYLSRVDTGEAHVDYGFDNLANRSIFVNASLGMITLDGPGTAYDSYAWPQAYSDSWERQVNLYSSSGDSGVYEVSAYIHSTGVLYDCYSSPDLHEDVYLY